MIDKVFSTLNNNLAGLNLLKIRNVNGDVLAYALSLPAGFYPINFENITNIPANPVINYSVGYIITNGSACTIAIYSRVTGELVTNTYATTWKGWKTNNTTAVS